MKTRFWREIIVAIGILPGLWLYLGVDPEAVIHYAILSAIAEAISTIAKDWGSTISRFGTLAFAVIGATSSILSWVGVYYVGGGWGILAVLTAFVGGLLIGTPYGIWMIFAALAVAPFLPVDPEHSFDTD